MAKKINQSKTIKGKWLLINMVLCGVSLLNLWVNFKYKYISCSSTLSITYLFVSVISINNAIYHRIQGKQKEFYTDIVGSVFFILLAVFMFFVLE